MNVREIIKDFLTKNGYDGLFRQGCDDIACGCWLDDLQPCDEDMSDCEPGYKRPCDCGEHDFHICAERLKEKRQ